MGLADFLNALGQGMQGQGPGSQQGGLFGNWTQEPIENGLGAQQAPQLPPRRSALLQDIMSEPNSSVGGGGLSQLLMRLGLFR